MTTADLAAVRRLQGLAGQTADAEGAAVLLDAALYLAGRENYARIVGDPFSVGEATLDKRIRRALRGEMPQTIHCHWTEWERGVMRELYAETRTREIAARLERPVSAVLALGNKMGLRKSRELIAREAGEAMKRPDHPGRLSGFKPGHTPANKGVKRPGWSTGRMRETQFRKGFRPQTWVPVGTEVQDDDGYRKRKVSDDRSPARRDWKYVHVLLWEEKHGPVPEGHAVVFKDGDRKHTALENLELVSRAELMLRNTIHNLPKELVEVIQLNGVLKRKINKLSKAEEESRDGEEQDVRSA